MVWYEVSVNIQRNFVRQDLAKYAYFQKCWSPIIIKFRGNYNPSVYVIANLSLGSWYCQQNKWWRCWANEESGSWHRVSAKPEKIHACLLQETEETLSRVTPFPACSLSSQSVLFTLVREQRMKTSSSTEKQQLFKVFFPQSCGKEEAEGENCLRLWLIFFPLQWCERDCHCSLNASRLNMGCCYLREGRTKLALVNRIRGI